MIRLRPFPWFRPSPQPDVPSLPGWLPSAGRSRRRNTPTFSFFFFFFSDFIYFISNLFFNLTHRPAFCTFCSQHQLLTLPESLLGGRQWAKYFICYVFGFSQSENSIIFLILQMVNLSFLKANRFAWGNTASTSRAVSLPDFRALIFYYSALCVCVCRYTYACVCSCMHVYTYEYVYIHIHTQMCICIYAYVHAYACGCAGIHTCMYSVHV